MGAEDARNQPAYGIPEAARLVGLPVATLRSLVCGREYAVPQGKREFAKLIRVPEGRERNLSFFNLVEAYVLRALRTERGIAITELQTALEYAQRSLKIERLLLSPQLRASAGDIFLDRYGRLINLSKSGQVALRSVLDRYLARVEYDRAGLPVRVYPFAGAGAAGDRSVVIDPAVAFGRPIIQRRGVSTAVLAERIEAGEDPADVASDYGLDSSEIEHAVVYELRSA
jgi:uncharacterized protein (DUF433 family)